MAPWLAAGVKVLACVHLGPDIVAGAGTVVTGSFAAGTTVVGVPARAVQRADLIDHTSVKQWELGHHQISDDLDEAPGDLGRHSIRCF